jgi:hypothetical protein
MHGVVRDAVIMTSLDRCWSYAHSAPPRLPPQVHHGFGSTLVRGIFANWLVGIATWQANAALDMAGKAVAIWCAGVADVA